ncbi:MAG: single-stranded DNA-binding protein [Candidatus Magasanikbacteria bacterium CG10_big_fil_rev_8_21_14_0_10_40_10]|uniref:Single-stranded DNA-binding protein n=1 Tax=Candidatus Magasanikbacteria bacterium CG10_big_fil_rev_8_21_14_0_10_40_10 TaxID=1974648 RepID=A0A2M6W4K3_9BACT|nr:MAG: single-stranded DNA-binding protein [Candidatus Magasanikbacteria bacterium CG10_big_fil_rev_8_21_14_0_10_40_10]
MDLNKVMLIGRLTRDPELRNIASGQSVSNLGLATNRYWKDGSGQRQEQVEYHNIVLWGKLAEIAAQYLGKGRRVYIEGRLQTREWTGKDGVSRRTTEIVAENMIMLDGPKSSGQAPAVSGNFVQNNSQSVANDEVIEEEVKVEDIPF